MNVIVLSFPGETPEVFVLFPEKFNEENGTNSRFIFLNL